MNPFAVDYETSAESQLAAIWLSAANPMSVTQASAQIEQLLTADPIKYGRALSEGLYNLRIPPLTVYYTVDQIKRLVVVSDVLYLP